MNNGKNGKQHGNRQKKRRPGPVGWWLWKGILEIGENGVWVGAPKKGRRHIWLGFYRQFHNRRRVQLDSVTGEVRVDGKLIPKPE